MKRDIVGLYLVIKMNLPNITRPTRVNRTGRFTSRGLVDGIMIIQFTSRMLKIKPVTFLLVYLSANDGTVL